MQISAVNQEITLNGCVQNCFRSGYNAMAQMAKTVQTVASKAFSFATNPFVVSFGAGSTFALSYATSFSVAKSFMLFTGSLTAGIGATIATSYIYTKLFSKQEVEEVETTVSTVEHPIVSITKENFRKEVLESDLPVVLDAYATWCGPCKMVAPILAELNENLQGRVKFVKFNVEKDQELLKELNIEAMPTFVFFKDGKVVGRHVGAMGKADILVHIVDVLALKAEPQKL